MMTVTKAAPSLDGMLITTTSKDGRGSVVMGCRARLFVNPPFYVVLFSDAGDENPGPSITSGIGAAAKAFLQQNPEIPAARVIWIEHYDSRDKQRALRRGVGYITQTLKIGREESADTGESFDLVSFRTPEFELPSWKRIPKSQVEDLIGGALD